MYQALETICFNQFDLLCIFKEGFIQEEITQDKGKIYIGQKFLMNSSLILSQRRKENSSLNKGIFNF